MTGQQQGHDFVPDLPLRHAGTGFVSSEHQQREQIASVVTATPLADDVVDHLIETPDRTGEPAVAGRRNPGRDEESQARESAEIEVLNLSSEAGDLLATARHVGVN